METQESRNQHMTIMNFLILWWDNFRMQIQESQGLSTHSKQRWVVLTQIWVKYGQTQKYHFKFDWVKNMFLLHF